MCLYFPMKSGGCERWTTADRFNTSLEPASISLWNPLQIRYQSFGMIFLRSANRATRPSGGSFRSIFISYFSDSENAPKRAVQLFFDSFNIFWWKIKGKMYFPIQIYIFCSWGYSRIIPIDPAHYMRVLQVVDAVEQRSVNELIRPLLAR